MKQKQQVNTLIQTLSNAEDVLILPHNNPDPDAIASATAMQYLLEHYLDAPVRVGYRGIFGRAENRALARYISTSFTRLTLQAITEASAIVLLDTQPGFGNNALTADQPPAVVIDHHPLLDESKDVAFADIRPELGATSTILVEYLKAAKLAISPELATALFYGIKSDTMGLERESSDADRRAFCHLLPLVDIEALYKIERAQLSQDDFRSFATALVQATIFENAVVSYLGEIRYPDMPSSIADFLLRLRNCRWVICTGYYSNDLIISVRTVNKRGAGKLVRDTIADAGSAGGHGSMAGGRIPIGDHDPQALAVGISIRMLQKLGIEAYNGGKPLFERNRVDF